MKRIYLLILFLPAFVICQIPPGYYNSAQGLTGNNLKVALHNIIKNHTVVAYSGLWSVFPKSDKKSNGKVWDIYSHVPSGTQPYEYTFVNNQCGTYNSEGDCYNREHSWPQSWFNATTGPDSDLFHIYPTDGKVNGQRANFPYGKVGTASWTSMNGSKLGNCISAGYSATVFEPINEYKGDVARSYFYMTTRYYSEDAAWGVSDATNKADILPWQLNLLLQWHQQDPVSSKEIARNDSIYKVQNNRNPFIDNPAFADSIWSAVVSVFEREIKNVNSYYVYPNPAEDNITIASSSGSLSSIKVSVSDVTGRVVSEETILFSEATIASSQWPAGMYFINVNDGRRVSTLKFVKL